MGIKSVIRSIVPSSLWESIKRCRNNYVLSYVLRSTAIPAFVLMDEDESDFEGYYSQARQDYVLDKYIFKQKEHGFFLDIGGNDPVIYNNTYFFEKNRGWTGLAFEPIEFQRVKWKDARKTECLPYALGNMTGEAEFCEYDTEAMSGFSKSVNYDGNVRARYNVPVRRLTDILEERGITHVDFVSLDVEGAEIDVLNGIDFGKIDIDCFTIENNKGPKKEKAVINFMKNAGYRIKAKLWLDEVWVKINSLR